MRCRYKLLVIRQVLQQYDYVMYLDSDAFFLMQRRTVEDLVKVSSSGTAQFEWIWAWSALQELVLISAAEGGQQHCQAWTACVLTAGRMQEFRLDGPNHLLIPSNRPWGEVANTGVMLFRRGPEADASLRDWW